jgi:hypothetical protein
VRCSRAPCQRGVLERHPNPMVVQSHVSGRGVKVLAEACGGSRARGREGLSGLPQHQKPARMGFGKGSTNYPPCPWAAPTPTFAKQYARREGILRHHLGICVRAFGMRRSRSIGLEKTHLQHVGIAAASNLDRAVAPAGGRFPCPHPHLGFSKALLGHLGVCKQCHSCARVKL